MSKTLINQNTFNLKNVNNNNDVAKLKVNKIIADNATITNATIGTGNITNATIGTGTLTNATITNATITNLTNSQFQPKFVLSATNPLSLDTSVSPNILTVDSGGESSIVSGGSNLITGGGIYQYLLSNYNKGTESSIVSGGSNLVTGGGIYQYLLSNYNKKLTNGSSNQLTIDDTGTGIDINNEISLILATSATQTDFGVVTGKVLDDILTAGYEPIVSSTNKIPSDHIDWTNTTIDHGVVITDNANSFEQLLLKPTNSNGQDAIFRMRGARNGVTDGQTIQIVMENFDDNDGGSGSTNTIAKIVGSITDSTNNNGGLKILTYIDNVNTSGFTIDPNGNVHIGANTFQSDYKCKIEGNLHVGNISHNKNDTPANLVIGVRKDEGDVTPTNSYSYIDYQENKMSIGAEMIEFLHSSSSVGAGTVGFTIDDGTNNSQQQIYTKQGLILDPFDMPATTFTNGQTDSNPDSSSRTGTYLKLAPSATTTNDYVYLRQIGTASSAGHVVMDFLDDANDCKFSFRNNRSTTTPDTITSVFDVFTTGVAAHTNFYRVPQMVIYSFNRSDAGTNSNGDGRWGGSGSGGYGLQTNVVKTRRTGSSFTSISSGVITLSAAGYYRIRVSGNQQEIGYNNRVAFGMYLRVGTKDYWQDDDYNFFGWEYLRNSSDGGHSSISFEDYLYIGQNVTLQVRHRLDTDNRNFDNTLSQDQMRNYATIQIERISENNIIA